MHTTTTARQYFNTPGVPRRDGNSGIHIPSVTIGDELENRTIRRELIALSGSRF